MKRLTIPGSGTESRATKPARVSALAPRRCRLGASREDTGADLLEAAQAAEIEQQATLEAAPVEQSTPKPWRSTQAKHDQVEHIEDRLENLIDRQQALLAADPGVRAWPAFLCPALSEPGRNQQAQQQARLQTLHARLEAVREIKEGMGLHSPKIEELATRKMRAENPELVSDWDAMREAARRHELLMRKQEQEQQSQAQERPGRSSPWACQPGPRNEARRSPGFFSEHRHFWRGGPPRAWRNHPAASSQATMPGAGQHRRTWRCRRRGRPSPVLTMRSRIAIYSEATGPGRRPRPPCRPRPCSSWRRAAPRGSARRAARHRLNLTPHVFGGRLRALLHPRVMASLLAANAALSVLSAFPLASSPHRWAMDPVPT